MTVNSPPRPGQCCGPDPFSWLDIQRLQDQIQRLEPGAFPGAIAGTIALGVPVLAHGTFSFSGSYSTGGEDLSASVVPSAVDVQIMPKAAGGVLYTFEYDVGAAKMLAYDASTAAEVANGTDLSALASLVYVAVGTAPSETAIYRAQGVELFYGVDLYVATTFAFDASDYWTLQVVRRTQAGENFNLGTALSLDTRNLSANTATRIADFSRGEELAAGDTIYLSATSTGSPVPLTQLSTWPDVRRRVE